MSRCTATAPSHVVPVTDVGRILQERLGDGLVPPTDSEPVPAVQGSRDSTPFQPRAKKSSPAASFSRGTPFWRRALANHLERRARRRRLPGQAAGQEAREQRHNKPDVEHAGMKLSSDLGKSN